MINSDYFLTWCGWLPNRFRSLRKCWKSTGAIDRLDFSLASRLDSIIKRSTRSVDSIDFGVYRSSKLKLHLQKIKYGENDFQYGRWHYYTLQCGTIMTLISPGDCTLQCGMWLWNHDSEFIKWQHPALWYMALGWHAIEFARWQHPAMWHVTLGSWHWVRQVAAPCSVSGGSGMTCHWIRPNVPHIGILHMVSILINTHDWLAVSAPEAKAL